MKHVLFIDTRNVTRSQIAEAWFNHIAGEWAHADSCGTMPAHAVDPRARQVMLEVGLDIRSHSPKFVNQQMLAQAGIVVLMGKDVQPHVFKPDHVWDLKDPAGESLDAVRVLRDEIWTRVLELIAEIRMSELDSITTIRQWETLMLCLAETPSAEREHIESDRTEANAELF